MKSKQKAPSLSARISEVESRADHFRDRIMTIEDQLISIEVREAGRKRKDSQNFDWFLIGVYAVIVVIYLLIIFKSKKQ